MPPAADHRPVLVIAGPTAAGKTAVSLALAARLRIEIVCADARQVYRHLDIGTAKPTPDEQRVCPHHCIDLLEPSEPYNAADYARDAAKAIAGIAPDVLPVLVGGSGLYIDALLDGLSESVVATDPDVRVHLHARLEHEGREALYRELAIIDPRAAARYADMNPRRVLRALEYHRMTGTPFSSTWDTPRIPGPYEPYRIVVTQPRPILYERINRRCDVMWEAGLLRETERVLAMGIPPTAQALHTVGYTEALAVLRGEMDTATALERMKQSTRNYAKRQLTWFGRDQRYRWHEGDPAMIAEKIVTDTAYEMLIRSYTG